MILRRRQQQLLLVVGNILLLQLLLLELTSCDEDLVLPIAVTTARAVFVAVSSKRFANPKSVIIGS